MKSRVQIEVNRLEQEYYDKLEESLASLRSLRHDMKNHLIVINGYAQQNNTDKIISHIKKLTSIYETDYVFTTSSDVVSSIINAKYQLCKNHNITLELNQNFTDIQLDDYTILTILGNLLDNAIRAAGKTTNGKITLDFVQKGSYLTIKCINNHQEKIVEKDGDFKSSKEDAPVLHGIGLKNVKKAVDDARGIISFQYDDSTFEVSISIPNYLQ